ncbi:pentapeptide repeat-containing protein [Halococcus sp. IIIV-5B]|uniref:pentapeptide repeat-containing protein n=1 Tax=Halococcus sp. IIIV-5B TaxID=2321230 RepID=UPI000E73ABC8|nr:pentapeptide repeat-containing protein [Halococcus sp. IIIV-5B]RJT07567.1 hypothetical protein D3261_02950 [Halococcus sp. IIIV-5B]
MSKCNYRLPATEVANPVRPNYTGYQCNRDAWESGKCIWHANSPNKPISELQKEFDRSGRKLVGAKLYSIHFEDSIDFSEADLLEADIRSCDFRHAEMENVAFAGSKIQDSNFSGAELSYGNAVFSEIKNVNFDQANLYRFSFAESEMSNVNIHGRNMEKSTFSAIDLSRVNIPDIDFHNVNFSGSNLYDRDLRGSSFIECDFSGADLTDVDFGGVGLNDGVFTGATMAGTHFGGADLTDATFGEDDLTTCGFGGATLEGVDFESADLSGQDLSGLNMRESNLNGADLSNANMEGGNLQECELENTVIEDANLRITDLSGAYTYQCYMNKVWVNSESTFYPSGYDEKDNPEYDKSARVYRNYQNIFRENSLPEISRRFRIYEKDIRVKSKISESPIVGRVSLLSRWVWLYAESWKRILATSAVIIALYSVLYNYMSVSEASPISSRQVVLGHTINFPGISYDIINAIYFSVSTFTTLGYGDIQPNSIFTRILAGSEALVGSLLIAALLFVIGRRTTW